jgi:hypothetical protein
MNWQKLPHLASNGRTDEIVSPDVLTRTFRRNTKGRES